MVGTTSRTTLAAKAIARLRYIVKQLLEETNPTKKSARNFYSHLDKELTSAREWLRDPCSRDRESELLVCLEFICAGGKVQLPDTSLEAQKFANVENLNTSNATRIKCLLQELAESRTPTRENLKKSVLNQLKTFSPDGADTSQVVVADWRRESQSPTDIREAMVALYEAFSKHKQCHDASSDTTEPLVTQMCLSEAKLNNAMEVRISLLVLIHIHTKPYGAGSKRWWRHVEIDVFRRRLSAIQSRQTPRMPITPTQTMKTRAFCRKVSQGIQTQLLRLEVRDEKLYFRETLPSTTRWVLNAPSITLTSLIQHKCIKESDELKLLICTAVARAVWHFYGSGWWESNCTRENFRFVWASSATDSSPQLTVNNLFFYSSMEEFDNDEGAPGSSHSRPMILALGIILLEVQLGVLIEEARTKKELSETGAVSPDTNLFVAIRLCEAGTAWTGKERVRSIIETCITGQIFRPPDDHEEVRRTLLNNVVEPLEALLSEKAETEDLETRCIPDACTAFGSFVMSEGSTIGSSATQTTDRETAAKSLQRDHDNPMISAKVLTCDETQVPNSSVPALVLAENKVLNGKSSDIDPDSPNKEEQKPKPTVDQAQYDGTFYAHTKNDLQDPGTFETLRKTWKQRLEYMEGDKVIKIAVLDTGIDMQGTEATAKMHKDFRYARTIYFDKGRPCPDPDDIPQFQHIKGTRNFCAGSEAEVQDLDGHGTAVAGIILRLAPGAELYIARICDGDINNGVTEENWRPVGEDRTIRPRPSIIKKAIEWAVEHKVNIINMSFGFENEDGEVSEALELARDHKILVFAAMANCSMHNPAAWPANDLNLCIGIHSCTVGGHSASDFTARPAKQNPNLMVVGENIPVHWLASKGGGFRMGEGTSFATPVAVAMGALILTFVHQKRCASKKSSLEGSTKLDHLSHPTGMASLLKKMSDKIATHYSLIKPELLWAGNRDQGKDSRDHAWKIIERALNPLKMFMESLKRETNT